MSFEKRPAPRLSSLDGVRGIAALIVLMAHCYLVALPHLDENWVRLIDSTPLNILFDGSSAVLVFFLLSGFVVALPALRPGFDWQAYFPRRIVRLYLPVLVSVMLGAALIIVVSRETIPPGQWASDASASSVQLRSLLSESLLLTADPAINNPLWSLTWEVIFSLLLPVFVWVSLRVKSWWIAAILACVAVRILGNVLNVSALTYLPVFLVGTIAAASFAKVQKFAATITHLRLGGWIWGLIALLSAIMLSATATLRGLGVDLPPLTSAAKQLPVLGGIGLVFVAIGSPGLIRILDLSVIQWLGRISFSLYLVHVPVLVTVLAYFGQNSWGMAILAGVVISFGIAWVFERTVEKPSHRLSKMIGRLCARSS